MCCTFFYQLVTLHSPPGSCRKAGRVRRPLTWWPCGTVFRGPTLHESSNSRCLMKTSCWRNCSRTTASLQLGQTPDGLTSPYNLLVFLDAALTCYVKQWNGIRTRLAKRLCPISVCLPFSLCIGNWRHGSHSPVGGGLQVVHSKDLPSNIAPVWSISAKPVYVYGICLCHCRHY